MHIAHMLDCIEQRNEIEAVGLKQQGQLVSPPNLHIEFWITGTAKLTLATAQSTPEILVPRLVSSFAKKPPPQPSSRRRFPSTGAIQARTFDMRLRIAPLR
jgi:hypothetical protein